MSHPMSRIERVRAAVAGRPVDRPPFTAWYHFGLQHAPAERVAQAHLEYLQAYDLDWLKVMNDYSYPMPEGVETVRAIHDLDGLRPVDLDARQRTDAEGHVTYLPGEQLHVIEQLHAALAGKVLIVDTVFNAFYTLRRNVVKKAMGAFMDDHPEALENALGVVNEHLVRYARATLSRGADGIFFAVPASAEALTRDQYERFMRPFDLALLEAIRDLGEFHVLHVHGRDLFFDRITDYPVGAISWVDRAGGPSIAQARALTSRALVTGIDPDRFPDASADEVREQVRSAIAEAGQGGFMVAPGCSIGTYSFPELIRAARDEVTRTPANRNLPPGT